MRALFESTSIKVLLQGGLGNQLFILAAGLEQAYRLETNLQLFSPKELPHGGMQLNKILGFADRFPTVEINGIVISMNRLKYTRAIPLEPQLRLLGRASGTPIYRESAFPYESEINRVSRGTMLIGYFQSWKYFPNVGESIVEALWASNSYSDTYRKMEQALLSSKRSIGVHIRRGDYLHAAALKFHGLPSPSYYKEAVLLLRMRGFDGDVFLFSDDPIGAQHYFSDTGVIVVPTQGFKNSLEVMKLLGLTDSLVLSNSSFSWWAAKLNQANSPVIVPSPWHRDIRVKGVDIYVSSWTKLDSQFGTPIGQ